jgi:phosphoserine phosphatase
MEGHMPLWLPSDLIIFDCDSTLSLVEGIDELARLAGQESEVAALTKRAMDGDIPLEAVYEHRMSTVRPTRAQLRAIKKAYRDHAVEDAAAVIAALQQMDREVFIVSGGLREAVADFGEWLGVKADHIFAVGMEYNQLSGSWWQYHRPNDSEHFLAVEDHPLTSTGGKAAIIQNEIRSRYKGRAMLVGDGLSDLEARPAVDLFVGFGGAVRRARVAAEAEVFIATPALSPVLALAAARPPGSSFTPFTDARRQAAEHPLPNTPESGVRAGTTDGSPEGMDAERRPPAVSLAHDGLDRIRAGQVSFGDPEKQAAFWQAQAGWTRSTSR